MVTRTRIELMINFFTFLLISIFVQIQYFQLFCTKVLYSYL
nr:MAG TPA: hypothetical protein [Caudoviricetes sp.]